MTADLDALSASAPEVGQECLCGCGEMFNPGNTNRQYKRGHKTQPRDTPGRVIPPETDDPYHDAISLEDAARDTPNDPDPADWKETKISVRVTKAIREDIQGKLGMIFGFMAMGISMRDPFCGGAIGDNADTIIPKLVPIICKSPDMVRWFTSKSSGYIVWFELMMVCWPVIQVIVAHHVTHSIGKPKGSGPTGQTIMSDPLTPNFSAYRA